MDDLISKCNFTDKQNLILSLYQQGLTEKDIAKDVLKSEEKDSEIHKILNTCIRKIAKQNNEDWFKEFILWDKKKTTENWKQCSKCKDWKPESDYSPDQRNKDGLHSFCKKCR